MCNSAFAAFARSSQTLRSASSRAAQNCQQRRKALRVIRFGGLRGICRGMRRQLAIPVIEKARRMCRGGEAELEAPPPWERTRLEAASPWKGPVLLWGGETSCLAASGTGVGVREASAAAVAKAFCKPSEFHHDTCLCSPGHILPGGDRALTIGQYV